ncbi:MAG: DUF4159 domain-containing protein [Gammaproteobacteria bacterium]|nr:DUF4159 domain-containing protein [Gammaproteobacteria bacterium]MYC97631.1 DUF4159 domain-containing protein [Gammaproteobacteria bacterium]MYI22515.1 DUF4159 domain-containing protein [Gammaproteobacteria bacterium]
MVTRALVGMAGVAGAAAVGVLAAAGPLESPLQPGPAPSPVQEANIPYDGRFTFVRIRTDVSGGRGMPRSFLPGGRRGWGQPPWAHDYPRAERNLARILTATTLLNTYEGGSNILTFDDPELHSYPLAYVSEPGFWEMDEAEKEGLRSYLLKGGFVIFDDFGGPRDWANFEAQMMRVLPEGRFYDLSDLDPLPTVFDSFFEISDPEALAPPYRGGWPQYLGIFEDNDPAQRLMLVANFNNDLGDYWEFSDSGWLPIDLTNEAYKFGVNYIIYAMTH